MTHHTAEKPAAENWTTASITLPDWTAIPLFFLLLLALSWWVSLWEYRVVISPPPSEFFQFIHSKAFTTTIFFPLIIFMACCYALLIAAVVSSAAGKPRTFTHAHIRTLMWIHGLIRFHIPTPPQNAHPNLPSQITAYLNLTRQGLSSADAITRTIRFLPTRIHNTLLAAQSIHCLEPALGQSIDHLQQCVLHTFARRPRLIALCPLLFLVGFIPLLTFVFFPRYGRLLIDLETPLPSLSQQFFLFCQWFTVGGHALGIPTWPLLNIPGFLWALIFLPVLVLGDDPLIPAFNPLSHRPFALKIPIAGSLIADHDWSSVYSLLSLAIARGIPLPQAIHAANLPDLNLAIKSRLANWQSHLSTGQTPAQAAASAAMPDRLSAALKLSATNTSLAHALAQLAHFHQNRADHQTQRLAPLVPIALTLLSGFIVGLIVLGFADAGSAVFIHIQNHWH